MKKQVEGRTSKQAPCNRTLYTVKVYYTRFTNGCNPTYTEDLEKAVRWYQCGGRVSVNFIYDGFKMDRPQRYEKTSTYKSEAISGYQKGYEEYDGMLSSCFEDTYVTWDKKWNQHPTPKQLKHIQSMQYKQVQLNTF